MQPQDVQLVVGIRIGAFSNELDAALGAQLASRYVNWFIDNDRAITLVAHVQDRAVGYVFGLPVEQLPRLRRAATSHVIACLASRPWAVFKRAVRSRILLYFHRMWKGGFKSSTRADLPTPSFCMMSLAVSTTARRQGVGLALLEAFEAECLTRAGRSVQLATSTSNLVARKLYERREWKPVELSEDSYLCYYKLL
jgi:GNAT superfamily N-acetyltransferase